MNPSEKHDEKDRWMRVLGVDPAAVGPTGYGIVEGDGRCCRMLHYGALKIATKRQVACSGTALQDVHELICRLIKAYSPDVLAVESVFTALNISTALRLAEVRGVVLLAAAQHGLEVHSYAPREVKANITGHGHADKRQMQTMVRALLSMNVVPEPSDAADALAVALCHLQAEKVRRRFGLPAKNALPKPRAPRKASGSSNSMATIQVGSATRTRLPCILSTR
jgi:crossover junction endodeoxyribonuclease RuvC